VPSITSFCLDEQSSILNSTPNNLTPIEPLSPSFQSPAPVSLLTALAPDVREVSSNDENNAEKNDTEIVTNAAKDHKEKDEHKEKIKAEKKAAKRLIKELTICKIILEEMEVSLLTFYWEL
jgi:hypothetical protein